MGHDAAPGALVSLVVPVFDVAAYLPEFLASLSRQVIDAEQCARVELVFVDDGSTDTSAELIAHWLEGSAYAGTLLRQENQGLAGARNTGLARATGTWVSFPDPDDVLAPEYLDVVVATLTDLPEDVCVAAARILLLGQDGLVRDAHPLRHKFTTGPRVVDLERHPNHFQLQAASSFLRRQAVLDAGLTFDHAVRPNFEDAYLIALLLRSAASRKLALVPDAHYVYRRREDGSSLVQQSWRRDEKYTLLPRTGYLRLLETFAEDEGGVPLWVQNLVLYDLLFYFRQDERIHTATAGLEDAVCAAFHDTVAKIMAHIGDETVLGFSAVPTSLTLKQVMLVGYRHPRWIPDEVHVRRVDRDQQIAQLRYVFGAAPCEEELRVDGVPTAPVHAKVRDLVYFKRVLAHERIAWVPATASVRLFLAGRPVPLALGSPEQTNLEVAPTLLWQTLAEGRAVPTGPGATSTSTETAASTGPAAAWSARVRRTRTYRRVRRTVGMRLHARWPGLDEAARTRWADKALLARAKSAEAQRRFGGAWAFMDRDTMAQDNAEHLYRWVARHRPEVNAWFVLRQDSPDWPRLAAEGFRLVDPTTDDHVLLMKNTDQRLSSQADHYVVHPLDPQRFGRARGRFTFLQHGVTKDDLSRWLNPKPISLLVTATADEHAGIAGDHTPYLFSTKEVALTGFPRHDRLLALAREERPAQRWLLVAPTWRRELFDDAAHGNRRELREGFFATPYMQSWLSVLASSELVRLAEASGLRLAFLPHPNLDEFVTSGLPDHVQLLHYRGADVQRILVETGLMVTDYSSLAFEQAYLEKPVVYFQPDRGSIFNGAHIGRRGTWSYDKNGFGPVTETLDELVAAVQDCASPEGTSRPTEVYRERIQRAFPFRDGGCCERVFLRVRALTEPAREAAAFWHPADAGLVATEPHRPLV